MRSFASRNARHILSSVVLLTPLVNPAYADPPTAAEVDTLHKTLEGKHVSGKTRRGGALFWNNDAGGKMLITANAPPGDKNWTIQFPGEWSVDAEGRYCVQAHAPVNQGGDWQLCKKLETAGDGSMSYDTSAGQHFVIR